MQLMSNIIVKLKSDKIFESSFKNMTIYMPASAMQLYEVSFKMGFLKTNESLVQKLDNTT
jgi:hypothetical protein